MKRLRNWFFFLIVVLIWGSNWPVMKSGLRYVDPLSFVWHRFLLSALALSPLLVVLWRRVPRDRKNLAGLFLLGVIGASGIISTNVGLSYEKSGISAVLTYTQPLFVFCLAVPFLKEEFKASRLLGVFTGFSGVVALSLREAGFFESFIYSVLLLLVGAFLWAVAIVYYKRLLSHIDPVVANIVQLGAGAVLLTPLSAIFGGFSFPLSAAYLPIILYASVGASGVALTIWTFLLREEEATVLSSSSFIIPMAALFFGWLLLGESVEPRSLLGAALIMVGVYLVNKT